MSVDKKELYLVGIGASAGGLEALERLFQVMPESQDMAFVVVQHLSPDFKSLMDELLARFTSLPIVRVENGMEVVANTIYLLPQKKEMIVSGGKLLLTDKDPSQSLTLPIDHFLRSVAQEYQNKSIAIILSGTGSDGSRGIEEIHAAGGLVIAQTAGSAKFDGMPKSAIDTGLVDLTMAPEEMADALVAYVRNPNVEELASMIKQRVPVTDTAFDALFRLLRTEYSIDFSHYKLSTVSRRIQRRLLLNKVLDLESYVEQLADDPAELNSLYCDLLIGVTQFFRDQEAFESLRSEIRELLSHKQDDDEFRIWIAGCATGEEAYSMAIVISEELELSGKAIQPKIFATDVHQESLNFASQGIYREESLADVDSEIREKYFTETTGGFQVKQEIRQWVVFAPHNVVKDAPFTKLDIVSCRNLLIYFDVVSQKKVISLFHFGLLTRGILFLGPSESLGEISDEFEPMDAHWKIFRKRRDIRLPNDMRVPLGSMHRARPRLSAHAGSAHSDAVLLGLYDAILDQVVPAAFLVDENRQTLHTFGRGAEFVQPRSGRPSLDLLDNIRPSLRTAISTVFHRAIRDNQLVHLHGVGSEDESDGHRFVVTARPIENARDKSRAILIALEVDETNEAVLSSQMVKSEQPSLDVDTVSAEMVVHLETELRYARENLQAMIEELETSNEELQATNEELVAANEELQSTNEELHSVNEELYTVNSEHQKKIMELTEVTQDLDNLLLSTELHTVFLDRDLRIRKFTPRIAESFNFIEQDIGRRIDSFTHSIRDEKLIEHMQDVLRTSQPMKFEVQDQNGIWLLMRILPYRSGNKIDGVVLTLTDISTVKSANTALRESISRRDEFLAMLSHELRNPLGAILNATYVLDSVHSTEADKERAYQVVHRQGRQMSTLMNDLLDVSRITQKKISLQLEVIDLRDTVEAAVESVESFIEENGQTLKLEIDDQPIRIMGDRSRLQQIQVNLLTNASKYSPPNSTIRLVAKKDQQRAYLEIHDEGIGIPSDMQEKIFDMFVQSEASLDRSRGGMGVGLTLVQSLVDLHRGEIGVSSNGVDQGSTFTVTFPLTNAVQVNDVEDVKLKPASGNRIVIVEDNHDAGQMLKTLLQFLQFDVTVESDGQAGLILIEQLQPDLAILDIGVPTLDGYEIATAIRSNPDLREMQLIALTGYGQQIDRQRALDAGFDEHLVKPLDPNQLERILSARLQAPTRSDPPPEERSEIAGVQIE